MIAVNNAFCKEVSERMTEKGFWEDYEHPDIECGGRDVHLSMQRAVVSEKLMLVVTELAEAMECHRKGKHAPEWSGMEHLLHMRDENDHTERTPFEQEFKDTFEDEIADTFIRLADLCGKLDIDIEWHIKNKMLFNAQRAHKHGKRC